MGKHLVRMITSGVVSWVIVFLMEFLRTQNLKLLSNCCRMKRFNQDENNNIDDANMDCDVIEEKLLVKRLKDKELVQYNLVIKDLRKCYGKYVAVRDMSVAVNK